MPARISARTSSQMPSLRGAANGCTCSAPSPSTRVTATTSAVSWSASIRTSSPGRPGQPEAAEVDPAAVRGVVDLGQVERALAPAGLVRPGSRRRRRPVVDVLDVLAVVAVVDVVAAVERVVPVALLALLAEHAHTSVLVV